MQSVAMFRGRFAMKRTERWRAAGEVKEDLLPSTALLLLSQCLRALHGSGCDLQNLCHLDRHV